MDAFISYSTTDRAFAGSVKVALATFGVHSFLAHEDLQVSEEWKGRILEELRRVEIFVAVLQNTPVGWDFPVRELTHADVGQMDGYVRMYDGLFVAPDDNPTIGLILCTEKNETVARYSVLNDRRQIFASKYMLCLPTEEQLRLEVERERRLIESTLKERADE